MVQLSDFTLVQRRVNNIKNEFDLPQPSHAFYHLVLGMMFNIDEEDIINSITDSEYLMATGGKAGHDRGIDAIIITEMGRKVIVNIFNFKYTSQFRRVDRNFESGEIDKILTIFKGIVSKDDNVLKTVNPLLAHRIEEIWKVIDNPRLEFHFHFCANITKGMTSEQNSRLHHELSSLFPTVKISYCLLDNIVDEILTEDRVEVNAEVRLMGRNFLSKTSGDMRALVVEICAKDLLRMVIDDEDLRMNPDLEDYETIKTKELLEDAFEDNVRIYLRQRNKINQSIKETVLSNSYHRFFYYNNGITLTCSKFIHGHAKSPVLELSNLQIVNGCQTIHSLYDAFQINSENFDNIDLLCRIYETENTQVVQDIAEYTNSQSPVKSRDIRSIDTLQQKLDLEFKDLGLFYERKRNQYSNENKSSRIDAEKTGQILMAFYNEEPHTALNKKSAIFGDLYDDVFHDGVNAAYIKAPYDIFTAIEQKKAIIKSRIVSSEEGFKEDGFVLYSSYYILFLMKKIMEKNGKTISEIYDNFEAKYTEAFSFIKSVLKEKYRDDYNDVKIFKNNKLKFYLEEALESSE